MVTGEPKDVLLAERGVVGCVVRDPDWAADEAARLLTADDFLHPRERLAFVAASTIRSGGRIPTLDVIHLQLVQDGAADEYASHPGGLPGWLADLWEHHPTAVNLEHYAARVRDHSAARRLVHLGAELLRDADDRIEPAVDTAARFSDRLAVLAAAVASGDPLRAAAVIDAGLADIVRRHRAEDRSGRVRVGFEAVDRLVPSLDPGELFVVAARPGVGKTAFALGVAVQTALRGLPTLFVSLEMSASEIGQRMAFAAGGLRGGALRAGHATDQELAQVETVAAEFRGVPLWVDDRPDRTVERIVAVSRRHQRRHGLSLLVVDYLQLVPPTDRRTPRREQVEHVSRSLKLAAKQLGCPVLALAQLNREAEGRPDGRPRLSDLREAGGIEQDADAVMLLWRRPDPDMTEDAPTVPVSVLVEKQRNGPTGQADLIYRRACTRFEASLPSM